MKNFFLIVLCLSAASVLAAQEGPSADRAAASAAFRQEGIASWYGAEFEGRPTASGEVFNAKLLTAAHPTLPFGTVLTVTNTHNGKKVVVRVNDRGPFVAARIIDVSRAAAEKLDMIVTGTAPVVIETAHISATVTASAEAQAAVSAGPAVVAAPAVSARPAAAPQAPGSAAPTPAASAPPALPPPDTAAAPRARAAALKPALPAPDSGKKYRIQVGSYRDAKHAVDAFNRLGAAGLSPAYERFGEYYRVVLAGVAAHEVGSIADRLGAAGFAEALVREER